MNDKELLTQERLKQLLDYDPLTGEFSWRVAGGKRVHIGDTAGHINQKGYIVIGIDWRVHMAHRLAWLYVYGCFPSKYIDHLNGVNTDNRIANLRDVSTQTNNQNRRKAFKSNKASGVLGVYKNKGKWRAMIGHNGKAISVGNFHTIEEASDAYIAAKRKIHAGCTI
jgi:hypothetical protein